MSYKSALEKLAVKGSFDKRPELTKEELITLNEKGIKPTKILTKKYAYTDINPVDACMPISLLCPYDAPKWCFGVGVHDGTLMATNRACALFAKGKNLDIQEGFYPNFISAGKTTPESSSELMHKKLYEMKGSIDKDFSGNSNMVTSLELTFYDALKIISMENIMWKYKGSLRYCHVRLFNKEFSCPLICKLLDTMMMLFPAEKRRGIKFILEDWRGKESALRISVKGHDIVSYIMPMRYEDKAEPVPVYIWEPDDIEMPELKKAESAPLAITNDTHTKSLCLTLKDRPNIHILGKTYLWDITKEELECLRHELNRIDGVIAEEPATLYKPKQIAEKKQQKEEPVRRRSRP